MISEDDKSVIEELAVRYGVKRILLFGSAADPNRSSQDIDLAVEGIAPDKFFRFYGDLIFGLSKPVDVIDLSMDNRFVSMVRRNGICIYG
jgi:uncharacterized protein